MKPTYLETSRRYDTQPDGGKNLEVAMAVQVFHRLQQAGLIAADKRLSSDVEDRAGLESTSYEARLVELIRDRDANGRLDLDLETLLGAGIIEGTADAQAVERHLADRHLEAPPLRFFLDTSRKSDLADYGLTTKGRDVRALSEGMRLESSAHRSAENFLAKDGVDVNEALAVAGYLESAGKPQVARRVLSSSADRLQGSEAITVLRSLTRAPHADTTIHAGQAFLDRMNDPSFDPTIHAAVFSDGGNETKVDVNKFRTTVGRVASLRISQIELAGRMEVALGRPVDPYATDDVRSYFSKLSDGKNGKIDTIRAEFQSYLRAFFVHAGEGVAWSKSVPLDERPGRIDDLIAGQPTDAAGRRLIDCECYSYLADHILSSDRFGVLYVQRPGHIAGLVLDRTNQRAFGVDNDDVDDLGTITNERQLADAAGRMIAGNGYAIFHVADRPSRASAADETGLPKRGAVAWNGRVVGFVDERTIEHYAEAVREHGARIGFSEYVRSVAGP